MENKENVCVETEAEQIAKAKEEKGSTALGKFKDANALLRAYEALEAEFTRRSQRLKELEKQADNFKAQNGGNEAEKLVKTAAKRKERERAFDAFVAELEQGAPKFQDGEKPAVPVPSSATEREALEAEMTVAQESEKEWKECAIEEEKKGEDDPFVEKNKNNQGFSIAEAEDLESLYQKASQNEGVRLRIVGDYLSSIKSSGAPITKSGAGLLVTPPSRAKSIAEAGGMALRCFEKGGRA